MLWNVRVTCYLFDLCKYTRTIYSESIPIFCGGSAWNYSVVVRDKMLVRGNAVAEVLNGSTFHSRVGSTLKVMSICGGLVSEST
jgi:hypothetical protein